MRLYPITTKLIGQNQNIASIVIESMKRRRLKLKDDDILALSSKIVSYSQGRLVDLGTIVPSRKAIELSRKYGLTSEFVELVLREADEVYGGVQKALLTLKDASIVANAGIDCKNAPANHVLLWPEDLATWIKETRQELFDKTKKKIGILVVDSGLIPLRIGTIGLALAVAGFNPIKDHRGKNDLFGRKITITRHAVADDLASAAHLLMGESIELNPIVLIRDAPVEFGENSYGSNYLMMPFKDCLFMGTLMCGRKSQ